VNQPHDDYTIPGYLSKGPKYTGHVISIAAARQVNMSADRPIASLLDADIYARDVVLLERGQWLNDACINFAFRCIEKTLISRTILLLDPAVVSFFFIQCEDEEEMRDFIAGNEINAREWLFIPITNRLSFAEASVHWSLLMIHKPSSKLMHFDSHGGYNTKVCVYLL
jgi:Ulp1 family protease